MRSLMALCLILLTAGIAGAQEEKMELRFYDVSTISTPRLPAVGPHLGAAQSHHFGRQEAEDMEPTPAFEGDAIADMIREMVDTDVWDEGGDIMYREGGLIMANAPARTHMKIKAMLADLAQSASRRIQIHVEAYSVSPDRTGRVYAAVTGATDHGAVDLKALGAVPLESASLEAYPGVRASVKVLNKVRYVADYDVEIAQGSTLSNPIVRAGREGFVADFVVHPSHDGTSVVLEALLQQGEFERPFRELDLNYDEEYFARPYRSDEKSRLGTLELPVYKRSDAFSTHIVKPRDTILIPVRGPDRFIVYRVRSELIGRAAPDWVMDVGALCRRPQGHYFGYPNTDGDELALMMISPGILRNVDPSPGFLGGVEEILDLIVGNVSPDYWDEAGAIGVTNESGLVIRAETVIKDQIRRLLKTCERTALRPVNLDLRVYSTAGSVKPGSSEAMPGMSGAELRYAGAASTLPGRIASIMSGNTMNHVVDYDVEVAQEARIADPIIGTAFEGMAANLRPVFSHDGTKLQVEFHLLLARRQAKKPFDTGAQFLGPLDTISEKRTVFNTSIEMPAKGAYTIDAGPDPMVKGRRIAVVLRAR